MKKKSLLVSLALTLVLGCSAVLFSGCKDKDKDDSSSSSSPVSEPTTYVVSFETNGGSAVNAVTVEGNTALDLSEYVTTKENNYFYGWCLDEQLSVRANAVLTVTENVKLYAQWGTEELYWLNFETGAGSDIASVQYKPNAYLAIPEEPVLENYSFGGWYRDEACTREFTFLGAQMPKKDLTVYAKWNTLHGIIFNSNGGSQVQSVFGETGEPVGNIQNPTKTDYIFEGWYQDEDLTTPYELSVIPKNVITVYAKWHAQIKGIQVTLHLNHSALTDSTVTVSGNEGESLNDGATVDSFGAMITEAIKTQYQGDESDLEDKPIYNFSAWAFDAKGSQRFDGTLPHAQALELYAVWSRSATYCQVSFEGEDDVYFVKKNTAVPASVLDPIIAQVNSEYQDKGCTLDGFYTAGGNRYQGNQPVAMDMRLIPYVYSANLVYEYVSVANGKNAKVNGYALKGYDASVAEEYKSKSGLLLLIPEYYNDGTHGQLPIVWVADNAFADYPVDEVTLASGILGLGAQAFKNTKLTSVSLPGSLYYLGDNVFSNSTALANVTFNSEITQVGATVFDNTAYETTMPTVSNFIFFDDEKTIIYGYTGTGGTVTTPGGAVTIAGNAFKDNANIKNLTLHDDLRYVSDGAFEGSVLETVKLGKAFAQMGKGIFKDCKKLVKVTFVSAYNLAYIGESMFEGCSALTEINVSALQNLQKVEKNAFKGCSALTGIAFSNALVSVGESAFENCTKLAYADFGTSDYAKLESIGNQAFKNCSSLRRIILRGELINNKTVKFGTNVLTGAGYTKNNAFVNPVIYVKDKWVDNWSVDDDFKTASYVDIYEQKFATTEYADIVIKAIDSIVPTLTVNGGVELSVSTTQSINAFDLLAFLKTNGVYTISDNISTPEDCLVYIGAVVNASAGGTEVNGVNGKYDLSSVAVYQALLVAEDEFGNIAEAVVTITVKS